jgi:hypothetical protein
MPRRPFRARFRPKGVRYDVFSFDGTVAARNVTAQQAAALVGITVAMLEHAVTHWSYIDAGGYRVAGHMQIAGPTS